MGVDRTAGEIRIRQPCMGQIVRTQSVDLGDLRGRRGLGQGAGWAEGCFGSGPSHHAETLLRLV